MSRVRMRTTATPKRSWEYWTVLVLGLFYVAAKCDARAVNVSNSWTMPQEGLNVFYRFFRDRISWFEADAVCQFHHAYLVTVDNSFQFDATRDLLRELDVNDIVWIGLMRPQSSDRFMWSNSRALAANTGYWAESLPLMESPLCAVIDPIRDYRWHALRCGGPETASFLCEMPVPSWAESCILKDLPSLTMQYMADTASIELIRNCGEEGLIRQMCRGKQDRERIMRELLCPRERLESKKLSDITNAHFKSLQIIRGISSDNNENNEIDTLPMGLSETTEPAQTENTVQKLIEQFNVDELMQADQPSRIPGEIPKPVKKSKKIVVAIQQKKPALGQKKSTASGSSRGHHRDAELADMMMGDQPIPDDSSNEIMQPLPHIKKVLPQDLKPMPAARSTTVMEPATTTATAVVTSIDETSTAAPIATSEPSALSDATTTEPQTTAGAAATTPGPSLTTTVSGAVVATVGHPMHPQQQAQQHTLNEEPNHPHVKETNDNHFIPPMLLVKSHYVPPPRGHADHYPHPAPQDLPGVTVGKEDDKSDGTTIENTHPEPTTLAPAQADQLDPAATQPAAVAEKSARTEAAERQIPTNSSEIQLQATTTARSEVTTQEATAGIHASTLKHTAPPESAATTTLTMERAAESVATTTGSEEAAATPASQPLPSSSTALPTASVEATSSPTTVPVADAQQTDDTPNKANTEKAELQSTPAAVGSNGGDSPSTEAKESISTTTAGAHEQQPEAPHPTRNFLNEETYPPFKPNRRRSLTKPDTPSYFKKILG